MRAYDGKDERDIESPPPTYDEALHQKQAAIETKVGEKSSSTVPTIPFGPLTFKVVNHKPLLGQQTIRIIPDQRLGKVTSWCMQYSKRGQATLSRLVDSQSVRELAEITYPAMLHHPYSVIIKFKPNEAEIQTKGARHVSDTDRLMLVDGYLTTTYAIDLPVRCGSIEPRVVWQVLPVEKTGEERAWTPFSTQSLVEERSGEVLASFEHSAPWAKETGVLRIPQTKGVMAPEFVEGIVVVCAAMVGFQEKAGLVSLIIESGWEWAVLNGRNKA